MSSAIFHFFLLYDKIGSKSIRISYPKIFFDDIYFGREDNISK